MSEYIPYGKQAVTQEDMDSVLEVLRSDYLTQGTVGPEFEKAVADHVGAGYGLGVNSATSALHLACRALDLGPGDWLWTTPVTFVASANCGLYCGARVDFVDIDPVTYNICVESLAEKLALAEGTGQLPKVVIPVHLCGQSCEMEKIHFLSERYGFRIIEDASHAIGGRYQGEPIGNCRYSDMAVFSFHPVKIITTAEGGMVLTTNIDLAHKVDLLRSHGITRDTNRMTHEADGPWFYQQIDLGYNYRMTELQAALGLSQLGRLDQFVSRRHELAGRYDQMLADLPLRLPQQHPDSYSAFHLYVIRLKLDDICKTRRQVFESLRAEKIGVNVHYIPVHTQPYFKNLGFKEGDYPEAESYYQEAISLPLYPAMTEQQQLRVVAALKRVLV